MNIKKWQIINSDDVVVFEFIRNIENIRVENININ